MPSSVPDHPLPLPPLTPALTLLYVLYYSNILDWRVCFVVFIFTDLFPSLLPRPLPSSSVLPAMSSGGRDGSVQSDASSSPSEQSQLGQSHPGYHMGPQVSEVTSNYSFIVFICKKVLQKKKPNTVVRSLKTSVFGEKNIFIFSSSI